MQHGAYFPVYPRFLIWIYYAVLGGDNVINALADVAGSSKSTEQSSLKAALKHIPVRTEAVLKHQISLFITMWSDCPKWGWGTAL